MGNVCPSWLGYVLINPLRRLVENPRRMLAPFVREGMTVLEVGPGMGFFTLDLARMVGPRGRVVAVDVQAAMLDGLRRRLGRAGLGSRVDGRLARPQTLAAGDLEGQVDLVLALYVVHETEEQEAFFRELRGLLGPEGRVLVVEPPLHVSKAAFERTVAIAREAGFELLDRPRWRRARAALLA